MNANEVYAAAFTAAEEARNAAQQHAAWKLFDAGAEFVGRGPTADTFPVVYANFLREWEVIGQAFFDAVNAAEDAYQAAVYEEV